MKCKAKSDQNIITLVNPVIFGENKKYQENQPDLFRHQEITVQSTKINHHN